MEVDPEAASFVDHAAKEARAAHRRELRGLALNALSTLFGTGMSLFAKISGACRGRVVLWVRAARRLGCGRGNAAPAAWQAGASDG